MVTLLTGPSADFVEECYEHDMRAGPDGLVGHDAIDAFARGADAHLMIEEPRRLLPEIVAAGASVITVHAEATRQRVRDARDLARRCGADVLVGVDGGVTIGNAAEVAGWGADVVVSGSAIFDRVDPAKHLDLLIRELHHPVRQPAGRTPEEVSDGKQ